MGMYTEKKKEFLKRFNLNTFKKKGKKEKNESFNNK